MGSVVLDVAIGMAFVYLLFSLIASVTQEMLAALVQSRAASLQRGLRSLLSGDSIETGTSLEAFARRPMLAPLETQPHGRKISISDTWQSANNIGKHFSDKPVFRPLGLLPDRP